MTTRAKANLYQFPILRKEEIRKDGDGYIDGQEIENGSDPSDSNSIPEYVKI